MLFLRADLAELQAYSTHTYPDLPDSLDRLDANESYYDLPPELKQKLAWFYQQQMATNRYPDAGQGELKQLLAGYVNYSANLNVPIDAAHISLGNGSDELIRSLLMATCLGGNGSIVVAEPTFSMYGILARTLGIPVHRIDRSPQNWEMNLQAAQDVLQRDPTVRVVFVVHPNSPTGNPLTEAEIQWLADIPQSVLVVIDEAYFEYCQHSLVERLDKHPNWLILRTFSKALRLAGHRVGYAIADPELIMALEKMRLPYNLPTMSQAAARLVLQHHDQLINLDEVCTEREYLYQKFQGLPGVQVWPSAANFFYLRCLGDYGAIVQAMARHGTLIRHTGGGLRITIGDRSANQRTLERLALVLKAHS